jgi:UDP-N-acetylglucosamine--N-acetylmuramyl-(pentapeptide) pyrophosphoryl-undecaprenol N-acetylglucosamine transferase
MSRFLLAGGGTGGHVNPLLALGELLRDQKHEVLALGTTEGLESRLVPNRGFELITIPRLPLPRKLSLASLHFPFRLLSASLQVVKIIRSRKIDCVVGFGGYASAPAYLAAWITRTTLVVHEANALAGFANKLGARLTNWVAVTFPNSNLQGARVTGMPIRGEIVASVSGYDQQQARVELGLDPMLPTLLVTGGSLGAKSINDSIAASLGQLNAAGIQVLHIVGDRANLEDLSEAGYRRMAYCKAMDVAISASDFAVSRAGASTVSEFAATGLPALYIPYPIGNGEQRLNAASIVKAGGGLFIDDAEFNAEYISSTLIPLISHKKGLLKMSKAAKSEAIIDATQRLSDFVLEALDSKTRD